MRVFAVFAAVTTLALAPLAAAHAEDINKNSISKILEGEGYNVRDFDSNKITVTVADYMILIGVQNGDISYVTYLPGLGEENISLELINNFNKQMKFARVYIDGDGDLAIQMDRNSGGGISAENIESDFDVFLALIWTFLNELESHRMA